MMKASSSAESKFINKIANKIFCGDSQKLILKIPSNSIDAIVTDPPYGLNKKGVHNDVSLDTFYQILPECHRVLKDDGWFITFFSTKYLPRLFRNNPFDYFWQIVLYCPEGRVISPIGFTKFMSCYVFKKGNPKMVKKCKDIFMDTPGRMVEPDEGFIAHPTPKPKTFVKQVLTMFTKENDIILDPFLGSGSTAVACSHLKRRFIGFEIEPKYCSLAKQRLSRSSKLDIS